MIDPDLLMRMMMQGIRMEPKAHSNVVPFRPPPISKDPWFDTLETGWLPAAEQVLWSPTKLAEEQVSRAAVDQGLDENLSRIHGFDWVKPQNQTSDLDKLRAMGVPMPRSQAQAELVARNLASSTLRDIRILFKYPSYWSEEDARAMLGTQLWDSVSQGRS